MAFFSTVTHSEDVRPLLLADVDLVLRVDHYKILPAKRMKAAHKNK